ASFLSEPVRVASPAAVMIVPPPRAGLESRYAGYTGAGYLPLGTARHTTVTIPVRIARAGVYAIDVRYANGSGPVNSGDRAAVRTLLVNGKRAGAMVMPQRGNELWTDWGYGSPVHVRLAAGAHTLTIAYTALDRNMNGAVNAALLDHVRLTRLAEGP
ncbi:MAG TPA: hypothetical protein VFY16_04910, partial [Gemmatimonadaceae bacterium]|nr:hypothetical protein [Gemmatimonadaceae bacterium]